MRAGYQDLTVAANWVNRSDPSQDGSRARPFTPGSKPEMRIKVTGFDPPDNMRLSTGGSSSVRVGGAAAHMSMGVSNAWYLNSRSADLWARATPSAVGFVSLDIRPTSVAGGLATWSMSKATFSFTDAFGDAVTYSIPALSGSFWIAPSDDPAIEGVTVDSSAAEEDVSESCTTHLPQTTHQIAVHLSVANDGNENLHNVNVEWDHAASLVVHSAPTVTKTKEYQATAIVAEGVIFGSVPVGATRRGDVPALTYCLVSPQNPQPTVQFTLTGVTVDGYAIVGGRQHDRDAQKLGALATSSALSPAPAGIAVTGDPELERADAAETAAARELMERRAADAAALSERKEKKQARADRLVLKYRQALSAYEDALAAYEKASAAHRSAADKAQRRAEEAEGKGRKARERAERAAAKEQRQADRLIEHATALGQAERAVLRAKRLADTALAGAKDAIAEADHAERLLKEAIDAYTAALSGPTVVE